jgi:hypothetical protein
MYSPSKKEAGGWAVAILDVWRDTDIRLDFDDDLERFENWAHAISEELILSAFVDRL